MTRLEYLEKIAEQSKHFLNTHIGRHLFLLKASRETNSEYTELYAYMNDLKVEIDDRKFVTDLSNDDMNKVDEQNLGIVVKTNDNITDATSKLAQLKKKKE